MSPLCFSGRPLLLWLQCPSAELCEGGGRETEDSDQHGGQVGPATTAATTSATATTTAGSARGWPGGSEVPGARGADWTSAVLSGRAHPGSHPAGPAVLVALQALPGPGGRDGW